VKHLLFKTLGQAKRLVMVLAGFAVLIRDRNDTVAADQDSTPQGGMKCRAYTGNSTDHPVSAGCRAGRE